MNNLPSPYPEEQQQHESVPAQECEMLYDYPPHVAGFPQPDYPSMQQPYSSPTEMDGYLPAYTDGYIGYAGVQPSYANGQQPGANYINYAETQQLGYEQARRPFYTWAWKSWKSLWIVLTGLALLLLLTAGIAYAYFQVHSTPEKTLQDYCTAVKKEDGQALYNTYSSSAQNQTDAAHLQQGLRLIEFISGGIEDCTVDPSNIHETDPEATARVTFVLYNGRLSSVLLYLINEHGQWKVQNNAVVP